MDIYSDVRQIKVARKYLKYKILEDRASFRGHEAEKAHVYDLMRRTVEAGESHSAIIIGPRGSGKTTLVSSVLHSLGKALERDALVVRLHGALHHDNKAALNAITKQMQLENAVGDRVFGSFAENLTFLLQCLKSGEDRACRSMLFLLDEVDLFCSPGTSQTLLYNLFDITHSKQSPMCVIGITCRLDVMELLEKRVKSRFSQRHIYIYPEESTTTAPAGKLSERASRYSRLLLQLLSLPERQNPPTNTSKGIQGTKQTDTKRKRLLSIESDTSEVIFSPRTYSKYGNRKVKSKTPEEVAEPNIVSGSECCYVAPDCEVPNAAFARSWNEGVRTLCADSQTLDAVDKFAYYCSNEQVFRNIVFQLACSIRSGKALPRPADLSERLSAAVEPSDRTALLHSLSALQLELLVALMHHHHIFNDEPLNFHMLMHRYTKLTQSSSSTGAASRTVVRAAFQQLCALGAVVALPGAASGDHRLHTLGLTPTDLRAALRTHRALPTHLQHWINADPL